MYNDICYIEVGDWREHLGTCAEGALILDQWTLTNSYPDREAWKTVDGIRYTAKLWWCVDSGSRMVRATYDEATHLALQVTANEGGSEIFRAEMQADLLEKILYLQIAPVTALPQL